MKYAKRQEKKRLDHSDLTNTTSPMTSNISGAMKPERDVSHDSVLKRRASRHPVANKKFAKDASSRRSVRRHMSRKGEIIIMVTINMMDGEQSLAMMNGGSSSLL